MLRELLLANKIGILQIEMPSPPIISTIINEKKEEIVELKKLLAYDIPERYHKLIDFDYNYNCFYINDIYFKRDIVRNSIKEDFNFFEIKSIYVYPYDNTISISFNFRLKKTNMLDYFITVGAVESDGFFTKDFRLKPDGNASHLLDFASNCSNFRNIILNLIKASSNSDRRESVLKLLSKFNTCSLFKKIVLTM